MAIIFGLFVFLTVALVFFIIARTHRCFLYLAVLASVQAGDFALYLLPQSSLVTQALQTMFFGSFYLYGALLLGFTLGHLNSSDQNKKLAHRHLYVAIAAAIVVSLLFLSHKLNLNTFLSQKALDFMSVPLPIALFAVYQIWLLITYKTQQWPLPAIRHALAGLATLSIITVILHLFLLLEWLDDIWRVIIPGAFALAMYAFFVYVAFKFADFKRIFSRRVRKPLLPAETRQQISRQVNDYLNRDENFKNSELKLADVAQSIGVTEKQLSEAINIEIGLSYQNLLNQYRLDYVTEQLSDNFNGNILDLALEAGFGSKTAFNRSFKARFGVTPGQWPPKKPPGDNSL